MFHALKFLGPRGCGAPLAAVVGLKMGSSACGGRQEVFFPTPAMCAPPPGTLARLQTAQKFVGATWNREEMLAPEVGLENLDASVAECIHELAQAESDKVLALHAMNAPLINFRPGGITPSYGAVI